MFKTVSTILISLIVSTAYAGENQCPVGADAIIKKISEQEHCYFAAKIARECAWGSSIDVAMVGEAMQICMKDFDSWKPSHKQSFESLANDCNEKYKDQQGTMYRSMNAHCQLNFAEALSSLNDEVE